MKRILNTALVLLLCICLLAGCGAGMSASDNKSESYSYFSTQDSAPTEGLSQNGQSLTSDSAAGSAPMSPGAEYGLKIVYTASLNIETLDYDTACEALYAAIENAEGYIENSSESGGVRYSGGYTSARGLTLTVRVPTDHYGTFLDGAADVGNVTRREEWIDDITERYIDVEARLTSLETQESRLLELSQQAEDIDTLLRIEEQLSQVRYEIESYTATLRHYENMVSYSTVTIHLEEVRETTPTTEPNFIARLGDAVIDSAKEAVAFLGDLVIFLVYALPYLLLFLLVLWLVLRILRGIFRRTKKVSAPATAPKETAEETEEVPSDNE